MGLFRKKAAARDQASGDDGYAFGVPAPCPLCSGPGYIEHTDFDHRFQVEHCTACGHRWSLTFNAEGQLVHMADEDPDRPRMRTIDLRDPEPEEALPEADDEAHSLSAGDWLRRTS